MKIAIYIFFTVISVFTLSVSAQNADTLQLIPKETKSIKPIAFDSKTYNEFKQDKNYDYYHIKQKGQSISDKILEAIFKWLSKNINSNITKKQVKITLWIITIIVLLIILIILYVYKPALFYINRKKNLGFQVEDESIYALDFDKLIQESLAQELYSDAVRWTYLSILKALHDRNFISWEPSKTINEYVIEMKRTDLRTKFKDLSQQFLYYRYGNFDVSQKAFEHFSLLSNEINKRL